MHPRGTKPSRRNYTSPSFLFHRLSGEQATRNTVPSNLFGEPHSPAQNHETFFSIFYELRTPINVEITTSFKLSRHFQSASVFLRILHERKTLIVCDTCLGTIVCRCRLSFARVESKDNCESCWENLKFTDRRIYFERIFVRNEQN